MGAITVIWATSLFVVALWVSGGGVAAVLGLNGETVTTLGRLTGLVAANLLLYQVLLMARVPLFERGFGRDGITRMHRFVGFWSFWLMGAHIALLALGYAITAGVNPVVELWGFIWDYPGMLLATAGTLLILLVVITSIRRARRRLRYESWHLLHLYAYLGVGLALPHQLWTGADFLSSPLATLYWWSIWALAAASVLVFRIGMPVLRSTRHSLRVASVEPDGARGVTVRVAGRDLASLGARAGQFFVWRFLDGPGWTRGHPFSLSAAPGRELTLTARVVGDGTRRLAGLVPGTRVIVEGPYGEMTGERRTGKKLLMIGAERGSRLFSPSWRPRSTRRGMPSCSRATRSPRTPFVRVRSLSSSPVAGCGICRSSGRARQAPRGGSRPATAPGPDPISSATSSPTPRSMTSSSAERRRG